MDMFLGFVGIIGFVVGVVMLITACIKKTNKRIASIVIASGLVLFLIGAFMPLSGDAATYKDAVALYESSDWNEALEKFITIEEYKDANDYINNCRYEIGTAAFNNKDYAKAIDNYKLIAGFKDADEKLSESQYQYGISLFNAKDYVKAADVFAEIADYKEASDYLDKSQLELKYSKFDFRSSSEKYEGFYADNGRIEYDVNDKKTIENELQIIYGKWYDSQDNALEITKSTINKKRYYLLAAANSNFIISYEDEPEKAYMLCFYGDYIYGNAIDWHTYNGAEDCIVYRSVTSAEYDKQVKIYEEEQAKKPNYSNDVIIQKTADKLKSKLSAGYSATERLYHNFTIDSSSVSYEWTTKTYTCYLTATYSTNTFDF